MKCIFLQDYDVFTYKGGAEMNDRRVIEAGLKLGIDFNFVFGGSNDIPPGEAFIISNSVSFTSKVIQEIANTGKAIFFIHDYAFCKYRLFFPMADKCRVCSSVKLWEDIYMKALKLIFLSPLHRDVHYDAMPALKDKPYAIIPSTIDISNFDFRNGAIAKLPNTACSVNTLLPFKGADNIIEYIKKHPEIQFDIISDNPADYVLPSNAILHPRVAWENIQNFYAAHEFYVELPSTPQPFNRTFIEAKLSGCKIITNELSGAFSYPELRNGSIDDINKILLDAPNKFWREVLSCLS